MQGVLSPPQPLGSSLLLPRPWALLLRVLLQQGVPEQLLQQLTQPSLGDESALESAVWSLFPEDCQKAWQAAPHRMGTAEAQVSSHNACGQPVLNKLWSCVSLVCKERQESDISIQKYRHCRRTGHWSQCLVSPLEMACLGEISLMRKVSWVTSASHRI